jgi:hypothetical protein
MALPAPTLWPGDSNYPTDHGHPAPTNFGGEDRSKMGKEEKKPSVYPSTESPFAMTLQHDRTDLSQENIRDLNRHKITRSLSERILGRMKADSPLCGGFNIEDVQDHPDIAKSVSSCSETPLLGLRSRQNSGELANLGVKTEIERDSQPEGMYPDCDG